MDDINKKRRFLLFALIVLIPLISWPFMGVERITGEFKEDTQHVLFIKKHISTKILFVDPTECSSGCDTPSLNSLNEKQLKQFTDYCWYRYDLAPARTCYQTLYKSDE